MCVYKEGEPRKKTDGRKKINRNYSPLSNLQTDRDIDTLKKYYNHNIKWKFNNPERDDECLN